MSAPAISVILPAYNSQRYIAQAIESVLQQTFSDFEIIIINDGSIDETEKIINTYQDERIIYKKNETNKGLIFTLNKAIDAATGKYIARMDADDICLPKRLEKQKQWLDKNQSTSVVACVANFIDEDGNTTTGWPLDEQTISAKAIRATMPKENCIAHPTVMMKAEVLKAFRYKPYQKNAEDYDLWMRLLAADCLIEKLPEKLLLYRVHEASVTGSILRKSNPFFKQFYCKKNFLLNQSKQGKWGKFESEVLLTTIANGLMGVGKNIKQKIVG